MVGDRVWVRVFKADGRPYRIWQARLEAVEDDHLVAVTHAGNRFRQFAPPGPAGEPTWRVLVQPRTIRTFYWPGRQHTLLEVYNADGSLYELYADVCSPVRLVDGEIHYTDHELDISQMAGEPARLVDEDEFAEAAAAYGYSAAFQQACYRVAAEALDVVRGWTPRGMPLVLPGDPLPPG